jgi:DNA-binding CsgD family transcriptional regulator
MTQAPAPWLMERGQECGALYRLVTGAAEATAGMVLIEGEAGIGKTSLLRTTEQYARQEGLTVLNARCAPLERDFAFGAARQLLEPVLAAADTPERSDLLAGAAALAEPVFGSQPAAAPAGGDRAGSYPVLHGLYWLTANLAGRQPLLITLDDVHWIDAPSLRWLTYLARRLEGLPVALAMTSRTREPAVEMALVTEVADNPLCHVLRPRALGHDGIALVLQAGLDRDPSREFTAACATATGGNPFLMRELVRALAADRIAPTAEAAERVTDFGPQAVSRHVLARLYRLSPTAAQLARALAVLGVQATLGRAAALSELDETTATQDLAELERIGVLRPGTPPAFEHAIVRAAIYQDLPGAQRRSWHAHAARVLQEERVPVEQIAAHLLVCEPAGDPSVVPVLREAAQRAEERGAPDSAAGYLRRALQEPPPEQERAELLVALGHVELSTNGKAAAAHLAEGLASIDDRRRRASVSLRLARALSLAGRSLDAVEVLQRAHDAVVPLDPDLALLVESELVYFATADLETAPLAAARLARIDARQLDPSTQAGRSLLAMLGIRATSTGASRVEAVDLCSRALEKGVVPHTGERWSAVLLFALGALVCADRSDLAESILEEALSDARRRGSFPLWILALGFKAELDYRRGAIPAALESAEAARDALKLTQMGSAGPYPVTALIYPLIEQGRLGEAQQVLEDCGFAGDLPRIWSATMLLAARGQLRLAQGDPRRALDDLLEAGRRAEAWGFLNPAILAWRSQAALAHLALGEQEQARELVHEEVRLARTWGASSALGAALRAAGIVEDGSRGLQLLKEAVTELERSPAALELARALTVLGSALEQAQQREAARDALRRALDLAQRCGASRLESRALQQLITAGGRPRRLSQSGVGALTPTEERVARMAAAGRTNRDIAQELFVTQRTVEIHLTHAYRKLEITGRPQLGEALDVQHATA